MNIYDFDGTIHRGDSSIAFYKYCLFHRPQIIFLLPIQIIGILLFFLKLIDLTSLKTFLYSYFRIIDAEMMAKRFWEQDIPKNIYPWFSEYHQDDDVLISASPEFFLKPACARLGIKTLIASKVDPKTGKTTGKNCTGIEKKIRFQQLFPDTVPERSFYDKPKDLYVSKLAKHRYLIINGIPVEQP